jgi:hypothetical protein
MNRSKRIEMGAVPKGGLRSVARPGGKDLLCKKHDAASISWAGRATKMRNADCGMRIEKENHKIRNPKLIGPMLFAQKLLAPGPRLKYPGNVKI